MNAFETNGHSLNMTYFGHASGEVTAKYTIQRFDLPSSSTTSAAATETLTSGSNALETYRSPCWWASLSLQTVRGVVKSLSTEVIQVPCRDNSRVTIVNYFILLVKERKMDNKLHWKLHSSFQQIQEIKNWKLRSAEENGKVHVRKSNLKIIIWTDKRDF